MEMALTARHEDLHAIAGTEKAKYLRHSYPSIIYESYELTQVQNTLHVTYRYEIEGLDHFVTQWIFPLFENCPDLTSDSLVHDLVFSLGLVELLSYWKLVCAPTICIKSGMLRPEQIPFWQKLLKQGMGEYFYRNAICADLQKVSFITEEANGAQGRTLTQTGLQRILPLGNGVLVPVGGGKDSIVTLEALKRYESKLQAFIINPRMATLKSAEFAGIAPENTLCVQRRFDERMLEYNKQGFLNGHTPFSALVAFAGVLTAYLHGSRYVVLSNEASANEATVIGTDVNHQYSKSYEFEADFSQYLDEYITKDIKYFSFLRPLSEYQIGRYFAKLTPYHGIFRSCNLGSKHDSWCNQCAKCLYVYMLLSAFLSKEQLLGIFGDDLLERKDLKSMFDGLIGLVPEKPFECVGSVDEINVALQEAIWKLDKQHQPLPYLLAYYKTTSKYVPYCHDHAFDRYCNPQHQLPSKFFAYLQKEFLI